MSQVTAIRITDGHLIEQLTSVQRRRGDTTPTKTARALILERLAQLDLIETRRSLTEDVEAEAAPSRN